ANTGTVVEASTGQFELAGEAHVGCCPSIQDLQAFHLGNLPEADLDIVAEHLESCSRCETAVREFDTSFDPLLAALRKPMPAGLSSLGSGYGPLVHGTGPHGKVDPASPAEWPQPPEYEVLAYLGRGATG